MVKTLNIYKNAIMYNSNHERYYVLSRYAEIEFLDGKTIRLDIDAGADITDCYYLVITEKGKLYKQVFVNDVVYGK